MSERVARAIAAIQAEAALEALESVDALAQELIAKKQEMGYLVWWLADRIQEQKDKLGAKS